MGTEIERKYLVKRLPADLSNHISVAIQQGYLIITEDGTELRVRQKTDRYFQTIKHGEGLQRVEIEIELDRRQFEALWPHTDGRRVVKTRYKIPLGHHTLELDVFKEALAGLYLVEIEFASVEESRQFEAPVWFGKEVTEDKRYKNKRLAVTGIPGGLADE